MKKVYIKPCTECAQMDATQLFATSMDKGGTTDAAWTREEHDWDTDEAGFWD